jgi:simple sugar transport system ATP-binding protein
LDIGAIENIHSYILKAKKSKKAILLISYELDEVMSLADRIVVVNAKNKVGEVLGKDVTKKMLGQMMAGIVGDKNQSLKIKEGISN